MRILVVEDDLKTQRFLVKGLRENGFDADGCDDGVSALSRLADNPYDLALLDIMLPGKDGLDVLRVIREGGAVLPVILLTAREGIRDRVGGIELGADDYLVKPVSFAEILARVRAVIRRCVPESERALNYRDVRLDGLVRQAWRSGVELDLAPDAFEVLRKLLLHAGEGISHASLRAALLDAGERSDSLTETMRTLQQKLDGPFATKLLRELDGRAWRLA